MSRDQRPARPQIIQSPQNRRRDDQDVAAATLPSDAMAPAEAAQIAPKRWGKTLIFLIAALAGGLAFVLLSRPAAAQEITQNAAESQEFAAYLASQPIRIGPAQWQTDAQSDAESARQARRWDAARKAIARGRGAEAIGWLALMRRDEAALDLVPAFRLARGAALVQHRRSDEALPLLQGGGLDRLAEACGWRLLALDSRADPATIQCAARAIAARPGAAGRTMKIASARAALWQQRPENAMQALTSLDENDALANLVRGRAARMLSQQMGDPARKQIWHRRAMLRLARAARSEAPAIQHAANLEMILARAAGGHAKPAVSIRAIEQICFRWRGGPLEWQAREAAAQIAMQAGDDAAYLRNAAARLRYGPPASQIAGLRRQISEYLLTIGEREAEDATLADQVGSIWAYRDLLPSDARGLALFDGLVIRLERAGAYVRAADLLDWRRKQMLHDIERGPPSLRAARLYLLGGKHTRAIALLREDAAIPFPAPVAAERQRLLALATYRSGNRDGALALLADSGADGAALARELLWRDQQWQAWLALPGRPQTPPEIYREAIARAMLGEDDALQQLHQSARGRIAPGAAREGFDTVAGSQSGEIDADPAELARMLAAIPPPELPGDAELLLGAY